MIFHILWGIIFFCAQPIGSFEKPPYIALSNPHGVAAHHEVCGAEKRWSSGKIWGCAKIDENCGIPLVKCSIYVNYPDFLDNEGPEIGESMFANIHSLCALGHEFCRALKHRCEINHDGNMTEIHEDEMGMDQNLLCHILEFIEYNWISYPYIEAKYIGTVVTPYLWNALCFHHPMSWCESHTSNMKHHKIIVIKRHIVIPK